MAYSIFSYGMRAGAFTNKGLGLSHYIDGDVTNYVGARNIENPGDSDAQAIEKVAKNFEAALRASITRNMDPYTYSIHTIPATNYPGDFYLVVSATPATYTGPPSFVVPVVGIGGPVYNSVTGQLIDYIGYDVDPQIVNGVLQSQTGTLLVIGLSPGHIYNYNLEVENLWLGVVFTTLTGTIVT